MTRASALALSLVLAACAHVAPAVVSDRLFCGLSIPGGGAVSQAELDAFVEEVIEPRFPQGFTMWRARGEWKGGGEDVVVFEFLRPAGDELDRAVVEIAGE
jgi:hypothetical protein